MKTRPPQLDASSLWRGINAEFAKMKKPAPSKVLQSTPFQNDAVYTASCISAARECVFMNPLEKKAEVEAQENALDEEFEEDRQK